jgi:hypothetical protein
MRLTELMMTEEDVLRAPMCEMANLYPSKTGLPCVVWFGVIAGQHGPRIKVSNTPGKFDVSNCFVMSVSREPVVLTPKSVKLSVSQIEDVSDWVRLNYEALMDLWTIHETGDGDVEEVLGRLQKV